MRRKNPAPAGVGALLDGELLAKLGVDRLLPPALARWRPLVSEGLLYFLSRLPEERLAAMLAEQLALGADAGPGKRLAALLAGSPALHKLGQVVARQRRLPAAIRAHLQALESMPSALTRAEAEAQLRAELGALPPVALAAGALAEGSVAVVFPFTYERDGRLLHGVFKWLKPGVAERLAGEIALFAEVAAFLSARGRELGLPAIDYGELLAGVERLLRREIHLDREQANLCAAARFYRDEPRLWVPALLPWCTPRLIAMERVFGSPAEAAALSSRERGDMAQLMVTALLARPFWSGGDDAFFHGDLHGGNLLLCPDGRLAVLDWSQIATLSGAERQALVNIALGGFTLDGGRIRHALAILGGIDAEDPAVAAVVERALDRLVLAPGQAHFAWLLRLLDELALQGVAAFREEFTLFRKSWVALSGVVTDLEAGASPDACLFAVGLERFLAEAPARLFAHPCARGYSTHLANLDLLAAATASCLAGARWWARLVRLAGPLPKGIE